MAFRATTPGDTAPPLSPEDTSPSPTGHLQRLLALPLPIPFTNSLPTLTVIVMAASMMEADGVTVFVGYALALATLAYFALSAGTITAALVKVLDLIHQGWR